MIHSLVLIRSINEIEYLHADILILKQYSKIFSTFDPIINLDSNRFLGFSFVSLLPVLD
jgi:hypothetical protein